jgi:hypothetical protein
MECSQWHRPVYVNFPDDRPSHRFTATWLDHGGIVWGFSMSATSEAFTADVERMRGRGFRLDMLNAR